MIHHGVSLVLGRTSYVRSTVGLALAFAASHPQWALSLAVPATLSHGPLPGLRHPRSAMGLVLGLANDDTL